MERKGLWKLGNRGRAGELAPSVPQAPPTAVYPWASQLEPEVGRRQGWGSLVESKAGAVPSAPLSCMGNTSTNSFLKTDSR